MKWAWRWWFSVFCTKVTYFVFCFISAIFLFSYFIFFSNLGKFVISRLYAICRHETKHCDVQLRRIRSVHFLSKDGKGASCEGRDGWKRDIFPAWVGIFDFDVILNKALFPIFYLDLACKQLCFAPGQGINRRNESTKKELFFSFVCSTDDTTQFW